MMEAREERLRFSGSEGRAIVVDCDRPWRFVFWEKAQYVGCVDVGGGAWFTSEWCETNSPNDLHCYEPIMDKRLQWSRASIVESGPACVKVRWEYRLPDMRYRVFHGDTRAVETFTIYPDRVALREVVLWPGTANNHGGNANLWQVAEWILINAAGTSPLDMLARPSPFVLSSGSGDRIEVPWPLPARDFEPLCAHWPGIADWPRYIGSVRLVDRPNPFICIPKDQALFPYRRCSHCGGDHPYCNLFPGRNLSNIYKHWPVTDAEDFIEWVPAGQDIGRVATHTSFVDVNYALRRSRADFIPTPDPGTTWYLLFGARPLGEPHEELERIARSYTQPAIVEVEKDPGETTDLHRGRVLFEGYDYSQRAFVIRKAGRDEVRLTLVPGVPQVNPVFVVTGWRAGEVRVVVDDVPRDAPAVRCQKRGDEIVVWISGTFERPTRIRLQAPTIA